MAMDNEVLQGVLGDPFQFIFFCPGCEEAHQVRTEGSDRRGHVWEWNGDKVRPTFMPSVVILRGHYIDGDKEHCWCTYNAAHPNEPAGIDCSRCHFYVREGNIQFLSDSSHALADKTVPLPTWNSTRNNELPT